MMDKEKKLWIIGGVVIAAGSLLIAWKQYKASQQNAASSSANDAALLDALSTMPLTGASSQPTAYSGPSADTGNASLQSLVSSILNPQPSSGDSGTTSTSGTGTGSSSVASPIQTYGGQRNVPYGGVWGVKPVGPEPVPTSISPTGGNTLTVSAPNLVVHPSPVTLVPSGLL